MAPHLYRRHRRDCKAGQQEDSRSGEFEERRRGWKKCDCPIFAAGSFEGRRQRKSTGHWEWDDAKAAVAGWELKASHQPEPVTLVTSTEPFPSRTLIAEVTESFLARAQNKGVTDATLRKYRTFIKQLTAYCEERGYLYTDQLSVTDMDRFYASWKDGPISKGKKLDKLRSFIKFCVKRKWLADNIADDLEPPHGASFAANKSPFSDEELNRMYAACDELGPAIPAGPGARPWGGEDARDFILLSVYTGLRISDVCFFNTSQRLTGNDVFLRMHKTKKELYTWIPDWLVARLRTREAKQGSHIFLVGKSMNIRTVTEQWRRRLKKIFTLAGTFEERPHPHRFRSTFARILLEKGVPVADVAELIGDTEEIVRKHYARFVKERQVRLTRILQEAFSDKPKPKVIAIR